MPDAPPDGPLGGAGVTDTLALLHAVAAGDVAPAAALERLARTPFQELAFATVDMHRELRQEAPEVVLAEGKTAGEVGEIVAAMLAAQAGSVLVTRADADARAAVLEVAGDAQIHERARLAWIVRRAPQPRGVVTIVSGGTADGPAVHEARVRAELLGTSVRVREDVGVAGLHRLAQALDDLRAADCVVVAAGQDAALASVVGGLVAAPVIGLPTSTGYGAAFGGLSALLSMLTSCATGLATVNIDDILAHAHAGSQQLRPHARLVHRRPVSRPAGHDRHHPARLRRPAHDPGQARTLVDLRVGSDLEHRRARPGVGPRHQHGPRLRRQHRAHDLAHLPRGLALRQHHLGRLLAQLAMHVHGRERELLERRARQPLQRGRRRDVARRNRMQQRERVRRARAAHRSVRWCVGHRRTSVAVRRRPGASVPGRRRRDQNWSPVSSARQNVIVGFSVTPTEAIISPISGCASKNAWKLSALSHSSNTITASPSALA